MSFTIDTLEMEIVALRSGPHAPVPSSLLSASGNWLRPSGDVDGHCFVVCVEANRSDMVYSVGRTNMR